MLLEDKKKYRGDTCHDLKNDTCHNMIDHG